MNHPLIDTHAHLFFEGLKDDLKNVVSRSLDAGITHIVNISLGPDIEAMEGSIEKTSQYPNIRHSIGVHPDDVHNLNEDFFKDLGPLLKRKSVVAIGETGLDHYRSMENAASQAEHFRRFINLARSNGLPLIIHQRSAFRQTIDILKEEKAPGEVPCVFHCFGGSWQEAKEILDLGFHISLTGIITFKKASDLREVVAKVPIESIMLETDSPFLSPEPKRGKMNEPAYIVHIARKLSEIKNISLEEIAIKTSHNASGFFKLA